MRQNLILTAGLLATFALDACGGGGGTPSASASPIPSATPAAALDGRTFLSTGITGHVLVPGSQVRVTFDNGTLGASGGCNSMSGAYQVVDGRLQVGQMATTEMGCAAPLMAQDQWLAGFLGGAGLILDGNALMLTKDVTVLTLTDRVAAEPDQPLLGTRWVVDGLVTGDAVSSVPAGVTASLTFSDGRVDVESGCNRGGGTAAVTDTTITFAPLALTRMACPDPAMSVEHAVTTVLSGAVPYEIRADTLTLTAGDHGLVLRAVP